MVHLEAGLTLGRAAQGGAASGRLRDYTWVFVMSSQQVGFPYSALLRCLMSCAACLPAHAMRGVP